MPAVLPVFEAAKAIMRADGNFHQWAAPGFPGAELLQRDVERGGAFLIEGPAEDRLARDVTAAAGRRIVGYFALLPSPEPTYARIDGAWVTGEPYGVLHRIASYPEIHGIFQTVIAFAKRRYAHLRIDTHRDNHIMQHLIAKAGFTYCGVIFLEDGSERLAYAF
ncbi:MAG: N-acetyltransferase [Bacteroidales bacterium]|nr:N-acetyltransferase [Bacteroidales bacterium]